MKNCWEVLHLKPTTDLELIKNARRSLVKNWHPDIVVGIEEKGIYNERCTEINGAFDQAAAFAKAWKPVSPDPAVAEPRQSQRFASSPHSRGFGSPLTFAGALFSVLSKRI